MPTPSARSACRGSWVRVTRPAASAAGQKRLPGRAKPKPAVGGVLARVEAHHQQAHPGAHGVGQRAQRASRSPGSTPRRRARTPRPRTPRPPQHVAQSLGLPLAKNRPGKSSSSTSPSCVPYVIREVDGRAHCEHPMQVGERARQVELAGRGYTIARAQAAASAPRRKGRPRGRPGSATHPVRPRGPSRPSRTRRRARPPASRGTAGACPARSRGRRAPRRRGSAAPIASARSETAPDACRATARPRSRTPRSSRRPRAYPASHVAPRRDAHRSARGVGVRAAGHRRVAAVRSRSPGATPRARRTSCSRPRPTSTGRASTCSSATSAGCRSTTPTPTRAWPGSRSSTRSGPRAIHSMRHAGETIEEAARALRRAPPRVRAADRPRAPRARARRPHRVAVPRGRRRSTSDRPLRGRHRRRRPSAPAAHVHLSRRSRAARPWWSPSPGAEKRDAFARVRAGDDLPAARIEADRGLWLVDPAAAG